MIREFNKEEVLEAFVDTVREKSPIYLVEQSTNVELTLALHLVIKETIEKVIKKASPDLSLSVEVSPIHNEVYGYNNKFEPFFNLEPSDVHFYISREADPAFFSYSDAPTLTNTKIKIDYHYPASWVMTPPRDKEQAIRRTMDEIIFAWTVVSRTLLTAPIVRFDDEEEAGEAVFAFANALLFGEAVADTYYYKQDFTRRLLSIQAAIKGDQAAQGKELATIVYPKEKKIGTSDIPVATIQRNRITQYIESYVSAHGRDRYEEYYSVLKTFAFHDIKDEHFSEEDIVYYLSTQVGKVPDDFHAYDMRRIKRVITNGTYKQSCPPMITETFKGIRFTDVCPFTYESRLLTYIHFEKDIVSHLEKTFKHLDTSSAIYVARRMNLPEGDESNATCGINPSLINLVLPNLETTMEGDGNKKQIKRPYYKNKGLYIAEKGKGDKMEPVDIY